MTKLLDFPRYKEWNETYFIKTSEPGKDPTQLKVNDRIDIDIKGQFKFNASIVVSFLLAIGCEHLPFLARHRTCGCP